MSIAIAMWSGPRNISTAMMRAWENRSDCTVVDEPFYACYLKETSAQHPCRDEVLASQPTERNEVINALLKPRDSALFYQKHMTHHMPEHCDLSWTTDLKHVFLIRHPRQVIASYLQKMPSVCADDIGIVRQHALFQSISELTGSRPPVIDSGDVLRNPRGVLRALCHELGIPFSEAMLQWPAGPRASDGVWADHWYPAVHASTGFAAPNDAYKPLPDPASNLAKAMEPHYQELAQRRLQA